MFYVFDSRQKSMITREPNKTKSTEVSFLCWWNYDEESGWQKSKVDTSCSCVYEVVYFSTRAMWTQNFVHFWRRTFLDDNGLMVSDYIYDVMYPWIICLLKPKSPSWLNGKFQSYPKIYFILFIFTPYLIFQIEPRVFW